MLHGWKILTKDEIDLHSPMRVSTNFGGNLPSEDSLFLSAKDMTTLSLLGVF